MFWDKVLGEIEQTMPPKRKGAQGAAQRKKQRVEDEAEDSFVQDQQDNQQEDAPNTEDIAPENNFTSLTDFYTDVINNAMNLKDETTGEVISGPFLKLPPKKVYPDYYQLIENPISINEIRHTSVVKKRGVSIRDMVDGNGVTLDEFKQMWIQMSNNASSYNNPESLIVTDANVILNYVSNRVDSFKPYYLKFQSEAKPEKGEKSEKSEKVKSNDAIITKSENSDLLSSIDTSNTNDSDEDYTQDLIKVYKHLLSFKVSHHKNSIPLSKVFLELPNKDDSSTEDYYEIVTTPMCFNIVGENLDNGVYKNGSVGYKNFVHDVNLIFDNALDVFGDGQYYKSAIGLSKAFAKRLEKFDTQVIEKRKNAVANPSTKSKSSKPKSVKEEDKDKSTEESGQNDDNDENEDMDVDSNNENKDVNDDEDLPPPPVEIPKVIRKHDIEKAAKIEEIDDITAFIKKFTICSTTNLNNFANNLRNFDINNNNANNNAANNNNTTIYENIIYEPALNGTVGGSTYILQLPGTAVIGHEISCIVHLQNKILDSKYISELKVNGELVNGIPMSISYDEESGEDGIFCASKYGIRLGFGLNYFEFTLKVPFPLQGKRFNSENENDNIDRHDRGKNQEFVENVKIWLNVTR